MTDHQGGYEAEFVEAVPDKYICNICTKPLCEPQLMVCCGQHYCHSCLGLWFEGQMKIHSCPHCRAEGDNFQHVINKSVQREILSLKVKCSNHAEGCQWIGELGSQKDHLVSDKGCDYVEVECPNDCVEIVDLQIQKDRKVKMKRKDLEKHLKEQCYNRPYQCEHCGKRGKYIEITGVGSNFARDGYHYRVCKEILVDCPNQCNIGKIKRKTITDHRAKCPLEWVHCPNKCNTKTQPANAGEYPVTQMFRINLEKHLKDECYLRSYKCEYCNLESTYEAITGNGLHKQPTSHYDDCQEYPLPCPNNCGRINIRRQNIAAHRLECPEETVQCPNKCAQSVGGMRRKHLHRHTTEECFLRQYRCEHCTINDTYTAITKHYDTCPRYPLECPNKCGATRMRQNMTMHCNKCKLQPVECPFSEAGCKSKLVRQDLEKHSVERQQQHLSMVMETLKLVKQEHQQTNRELEGVRTQLNRTREDHQKTKDELNEAKKELKELKDKIEQDKKKPASDSRQLKSNSISYAVATSKHVLKNQGRVTTSYPEERTDAANYRSTLRGDSSQSHKPSYTS